MLETKWVWLQERVREHELGWVVSKRWTSHVIQKRSDWCRFKLRRFNCPARLDPFFAVFYKAAASVAHESWQNHGKTTGSQDGEVITAVAPTD